MDDIYYQYPINDYRSYLQHHGVKDQKWYHRRAEWYPIAAWQAAQRRAGKTVSGIKSIASKISSSHKKRVTQKKRVESLEKARAAKAEKQKNEQDNRIKEELAERKRIADAAEQERVLRSGTVNEILKYTNKIDNKTLATALQNRIDLEQKLSSVSKEKISKVEKIINRAEKFGNMAGKVANTARNVNSMYTEGNKLLKTLGFIDNDGQIKKSYDNISEIKQDIYKKVLSGEIKPEQYKTYASSIDYLNKFQKNAQVPIEQDKKSFPKDKIKSTVEPEKVKPEDKWKEVIERSEQEAKKAKSAREESELRRRESNISDRQKEIDEERKKKKYYGY